MVQLVVVCVVDMTAIAEHQTAVAERAAEVHKIDRVAFDGQRFQCAVACLLFRDGFDLLNSEFCQI